ncbi:uncharacterized protein LOC131224275 [Magnolia sinica]|uniref:uncharacterized protein LOC131224275 n=1 Tax=Magnolia sinica TaxID=86752 RepID=UPI002659178A|nr:uncharacterized protein LOC131224275 [Magnolia sinica]
MTETGNGPSAPKPPQARRRYNRCCVVTVSVALVLLTLFIIGLILALTVFKAKDPQTTLISAMVSGVAPRVTIPAVSIQLNITLELVLRVDNPNHASFRHGTGKTLIYYCGVEVGDADLAPGRIPAKGSEEVRSRLTVEADKFAADIMKLIGDVMAGEVGIDTRTTVPGRVTFLGIFKRHAVALVECHVAIGFPDLKIRRQDCKHQTKL